MSTKGDEQGKKIAANTIALKTCVPGWVHKNLDRFFFFFFFFVSQKTLVRNKIKKNYFLVGAKQVHLHKCCKWAGVFFLFFTGGFL